MTKGMSEDGAGAGEEQAGAEPGVRRSRRQRQTNPKVERALGKAPKDKDETCDSRAHTGKEGDRESLPAPKRSARNAAMVKSAESNSTTAPKKKASGQSSRRKAPNKKRSTSKANRGAQENVGRRGSGDVEEDTDGDEGGGGREDVLRSTVATLLSGVETE